MSVTENVVNGAKDTQHADVSAAVIQLKESYLKRMTNLIKMKSSQMGNTGIAYEKMHLPLCLSIKRLKIIDCFLILIRFSVMFVFILIDQDQS